MKKVRVESPAHLTRLMGGEDPSTLTNGQRGLLEAYTFALSQRVQGYSSLLPVASTGVTLELNDTTGFEDSSRYPAVVEDFWPRNSKMTWTQGEATTAAEHTIIMSPVDSLNFGAEQSKLMTSTVAHELAHSLDLTEAEPNAYGKDGCHYFNEVTKEKAAFQEGFAEFNQFLVFPEDIERYRFAMRSIKYEHPDAYQEFPPASPSVTGMDLTRVEGVNAFILYRLSQLTPDGKDRVFKAFIASNHKENSLAKFLKMFLRQNPDLATQTAIILDEETYKKLSNDELRNFLGRSEAIEEWLAARPIPGMTAAATAVEAAPAATAPGVLVQEAPMPPTHVKKGVRPVQVKGSNPFAD